MFRAASPLQFCCRGCDTAYHLIRDCGLEAYYQIADRSDAGRWSGSSSRDEGQFAEYDNEKFLKLYVTRKQDRSQITLVIDGMHCAACVWLLEKLPRLLPGVLSAEVNWTRRTITIAWISDAIQLSAIAQTLQTLGYPPHPFVQGAEREHQTRENRNQLIRLSIAGAAAGNNMLIAAALYLGMFQYMTESVITLLRYASCAVGLVSLLGPGSIFLRGAWTALRTRTAHMDLPIALGLSVGGISGIINTILGSGEIYFDSLSVLVFVLLLGRWIQYHQQRAAAQSIELLAQLTPKNARRIVNGKSNPLPSELLEVHDLIEVRAGETFPADGQIAWGRTQIDQAILTGESMPVSRDVGEEVAAGTLNLEAMVHVRITAVGLATRIGSVLELVQSSAKRKPQIVDLADRIGGYFVVLVMGLAVTTLIAWMSIDPNKAVDRSVALLIVACPCALALATPLAISVGLGRAAQINLLIKNGDVFQRLSRPGCIWLDKTGTLTVGKMHVHAYLGERGVLPAVAAVQRQATHPIAKAIVHFVDQQWPAAASPVAEQVQQTTLGGISGVVDGQRVSIGNRRFIESVAVNVSSEMLQNASECLQQGYSPIYIAIENHVLGVAALGDQLRPGVAQEVQRLQAAKWKVGILSGDHQAVVQQVAQKIGVPQDMAHGAMLPEDKVQHIVEFENARPQVMVGDGVNDSAALAAADVGIAAHHSAETSLQAAPVYMARAGLSGVVDLIAISQGTLRNIRLNFAISLTYNLVAVIFAASGWINPLIAALLMPISSITVVGCSFLPSGGRSLRDPNQRLK